VVEGEPRHDVGRSTRFVSKRRRVVIIIAVAAVALAVVLVTTPLSTTVAPPRGRVDCRSALTVWSRPDPRALVVALRRLAEARGQQPPPSPAKQAAFRRLVRDAVPSPGCRHAAAVRIAWAGTLVFAAGVGVLLAFLFTARSPATGNHRAMRFGVGLGLIAFVALSVRVAFVLAYTEYRALGYDSAYFNAGWRVFEPRLEKVFYPPAFNALLGAVSWLGLRSRLWHHFVTCGIGTLTVVLLGFLGRRFGGSALGLLVAALAALYPMLFGADATLMSEPLYLSLVVGTLLLALRARDHPTPARFALLGLGIGLASATRGEGLLLVPLLALPLALGVRERPPVRRMTLLGTVVLVVALVLAPWVIRNYIVVDTFVPLSMNSAAVFAGANCDGTYAGDQRGFWRVECLVDRYPASQRTGGHFDEVLANNRARALGIRYLRAHASELPALTVVRILRTWGLYSPFGQMRFEEAIEQRNFTWQLIGWVELLLLLPLSALGVRQLRRNGTAVWPLLSLMVLVTVTSALTYGNGRFRIAAEPALLVLGGTGLLTLRRALDIGASFRPGLRQQVRRSCGQGTHSTCAWIASPEPSSQPFVRA
jgi:hypothetical protein